MSTLKAKIATAAAIAVAAGSALLMTAGAASAAATVPAPAITNDPNAGNGTLTFYDANGNVITSGNDLHMIFNYAEASTPSTRAGTTKATAYFAFPDHTKSDSQTWYRYQVTASTNYPDSTSPPPLNTDPKPVAEAGPGDADLYDSLATTTQDQTAGYQGILQIRVYDSGPGVGQTATKFWATDIYYTQPDSTNPNGTWVQVYPAPAAATATTVSTPTAVPASPAPSGTTSVNLSSTVAASDGSHPAGAVELFDGATDLGAANFDATTGAVTATASVTDGGSYNFTFKFTPTGSAYSGSTSGALAYSVKGVAKSTTTTLTGPATANTGDSIAYVATVAAGSSNLAAADGKVQFSVNNTASGAPVALDSTGKATFNYTATAAGTYNVTATFVPTDTTMYSTSTSNTVTTTVAAAAYNPDPQTVVVTVPKGTLVISTPYTAANPFDLGTFALNSSGTLYTASANFGDPTAAAAADPGSGAAASTTNGVTITDTRAGSTGWTASAQTTDFTNPGLATVIDGNNLTFTNVTPKYLAGNNLKAGDVKTNDIATFKTAKAAFATTAKGPGTVNITGVMGLTAPTSTLPGQYTATVTFTIA